MGCWGITAFESDAGLDSVDYIRRILPQDGKLELAKVIKSLQKDEVRLSDVQDAESHTSPMALAEIMMKFLDEDIGSLDYDEEWAAQDHKFSAITSFSASKDSLLWLRNYVSDTLKYAKQNAEFHTQYGQKWGGWFEEKDWIDWQEHMQTLVSRLNTLLTSSESTVELISPQKQKNGLVAEQLHEDKADCPSVDNDWPNMKL